MKKFVALIFLTIATFYIGSCSGENRHQFNLNYERSAVLTVTCENCFYYLKNYEQEDRVTIVNREIDGSAIDLFSGIKFCGLGDTTPDGWVRIETDTGAIASFGIIFPNQETNQIVRIQSGETGLGQGCTDSDRKRFEHFFFTYAGERNI